MPAAKKKTGLYANIQAKRERIAHGSGEKMRRPGSPGAPSKASFDKAAETEKRPARKVAAKKTAAKKIAVKKTAVKTAAAKKAPIKKAAAKKAPAKKGAR